MAGLFVGWAYHELTIRCSRSGAILAALAASCLFLGLHQTTASILQGLGRSDLPVWSLMVGAAAKVVLTYVLTGLPAFGIRGAAWATVATFAVAAALNAHFINRLVGLPWNFKELILKPILATAGMGAIVVFGYRAVEPVLGNNWATLIAIGLGIVGYGVMLLVVRAVRAEDLALFTSLGKKLFRRLRPRDSKRR